MSEQTKTTTTPQTGEMQATQDVIGSLVAAGVRSLAIGGDGSWYGFGHPELKFDAKEIRPLIASGVFCQRGNIVTVDIRHWKTAKTATRKPPTQKPAYERWQNANLESVTLQLWESRDQGRPWLVPNSFDAAKKCSSLLRLGAAMKGTFKTPSGRQSAYCITGTGEQFLIKSGALKAVSA